MKKSRILSLAMIALFALCTQVGAVTLASWNMDLSTFGLGKYDGVNELFIDGVAHTWVAQDNGDGVLSAGDISIIDGLLTLNSVSSLGFAAGPDALPAGTTTPTNLNNTWEISIAFSVGATNVGLPGFVHNVPQDALGVGMPTNTLTMYLDTVIGDGTKANQATGGGYLDGIPIAEFTLIPGIGGGPFSTIGMDGADDATFQLTNDYGYDIFLNAADVAISLDGLFAMNLMADTNFDADPDGNGTADGVIIGVNPDGTPIVGVPTLWPYANTSQNFPMDFFAYENGSASVAQVPIPEPSTYILLGAGILGLGIYRRTRKEK